MHRNYRQTLLVHGERAPHITHVVDRVRNRRLHVAACVEERAGLDPAATAALDALAAGWPWTQSWQELLTATRARPADAGVAEPSDLASRIDNLVAVLITRGQARFRIDPVVGPPASTRVRVPEPSRRMAELTRDDAEAFSFNPWHESVPLAPLDRHLLPMLDGTRGCDALLLVAEDLFRRNVIQIEPDDDEPMDQAEVRHILMTELAAMRQRLVELRLLSGGGA